MPKITIEYENGEIVSEEVSAFVLNAVTEESVNWVSIHTDTVCGFGLVKALEIQVQENYLQQKAAQ